MEDVCDAHCDTVQHCSSQVTEELERVKAEMDEKGTSMTDAGPLVRIKQSLTRLKAESTQMEVRIGVVCGEGGQPSWFNTWYPHWSGRWGGWATSVV